VQVRDASSVSTGWVWAWIGLIGSVLVNEWMDSLTGMGIGGVGKSCLTGTFVKISASVLSIDLLSSTIRSECVGGKL
jgi:hypothetical protein